MDAMAKASMDAAKIWENVAREQLEWAKQQDQQSQALLQQVLGVQLPAMQAQYEQAIKDISRYNDVFIPLQDQFIDEAQQYDTPERREEAAAKRMADVRSQFEAARRNTEDQLQSYGIDPGQLRTNALDRGIRAQEAATAAMAGNQGRQQVEDYGRAMRMDAMNMGMGLPGQYTQGLSAASGMGATAMGGQNQTTGTISGAQQVAASYGQMGMQGIGQSANITNMGYQNQMARWQAGQQGIAGLGQLAGQLGSAYMLGPMAAAASDPALKENRAPAGGALDAIAGAPAETWEYRDETGLDDGRQHVGPMADDVQRSMGIGDGTAIPLQDMIGAHHAALNEVAQRLAKLEKQGGMAIPDDTLKTLGQDVLESLIEKRTKRRGARQGAATAIPS
jgi:hypothetical protein